MISPYDGLEKIQWKAKTQELIDEHPLDIREIKKTVKNCWDCILNTSIGNYKVGKNIFPKPQIMGFFLHELICLEIHKIDPQIWKCEEKSNDKDIVNNTNKRYSIEIKTSHKSSIYGNRSYAQETNKSKKPKSGYYLAVNFESFKLDKKSPRIAKVRFGWLDHEDWIGQTASSGQQARLYKSTENNKLLEI